MTDLMPGRSALAHYAARHMSEEHAGVRIEVRYPLTMLDLRAGRAGSVPAAIENALGAALPPALSSSRSVHGDILWLSPDEWLLVAARGGRWSEDLELSGMTLCDVSHGRVAVRVRGPDARAALGKVCMLDLHPRAFAPGACAQTVMARMNVIVHHQQSGGGYDLYAARSHAGSFWHSLTEAAHEYGCGVACIDA